MTPVGTIRGPFLVDHPASSNTLNLPFSPPMTQVREDPFAGHVLPYFTLNKGDLGGLNLLDKSSNDPLIPEKYIDKSDSLPVCIAIRGKGHGTISAISVKVGECVADDLSRETDLLVKRYFVQVTSKREDGAKIQELEGPEFIFESNMIPNITNLTVGMLSETKEAALTLRYVTASVLHLAPEEENNEASVAFTSIALTCTIPRYPECSKSRYWSEEDHRPAQTRTVRVKKHEKRANLASLLTGKSIKLGSDIGWRGYVSRYEFNLQQPPTDNPLEVEDEGWLVVEHAN